MEVHRCRFVEYVPDEVQSLAISRDGALLVAGRRFGDLDVWSTSSWLPILRIAGSVEGSARAVAWAQQDRADPKADAAPARLFSAGGDGVISEWSMATLSRKRWVASSGGAVSAIATSRDAGTLAVACEDGCCRLFRLRDDNGEDCLELAKTLPRAGGASSARLLCCAWGPADAMLVAGGENGVIVGWDVASGATAFSIVSAIKSKVRVLIWSIAVLPDSTIVTGDSQGKTQFWSGTTRTLVHASKEHQADVLAVAASADGQLVFSAGVDSKLAMFRLHRDSRSGRESWVVAGAVRRHTHDVTSLVLRGDVLVSGSVDTQMSVHSVRNFVSDDVPRRLAPYALAKSQVSMAPRAGLVLAHCRRSLHLWRLGAASGEGDLSSMESGAQLAIRTPHLHVLELNLNRAVTSVVCSAVSAGGAFIGCSDRDELRVWSASIEESGKVALKRLANPEGLSSALLLAFSPDETRMCAAMFDGSIAVCSTEGGELSLLAVFEQRRAQGQRAPISLLCVSPDGKLLASGDAAGCVNVWDLHELVHLATVSVGTNFTAAAFTADSAALVLASDQRKLYAWDVAKQAVSECLKSGEDSAPLPGIAAGIAVCGSDAGAVYAYSDRYFCRAPLSARLQTAPEAITRYQPTVFAGFTDAGALVVVERPWVQVLQHLPPPFNRTRFGS